jgi:hypothetical protein
MAYVDPRASRQSPVLTFMPPSLESGILLPLLLSEIDGRLVEAISHLGEVVPAAQSAGVGLVLGVTGI